MQPHQSLILPKNIKEYDEQMIVQRKSKVGQTETTCNHNLKKSNLNSTSKEYQEKDKDKESLPQICTSSYLIDAKQNDRNQRGLGTSKRVKFRGRCSREKSLGTTISRRHRSFDPRASQNVSYDYGESLNCSSKSIEKLN